ncbi:MULTISPECIES: hypothetical protein [unclassified Mucilaginibacter]|uniref:hypothetical protein n=1 Tax=unclassified Mucilaginibacter TaxID=2617802 RepID=UPI002AC9BDF6|nr:MULTISPECIES: hypothetical protein [unclassified Mucilaginibacter]MEB0262656.1 hypothetical protein [Mucilaginibacter sp. 10I4]MEB0280608.1 hypothetical protein [Mucilaginibacter sp. 10B2]MEB0300281.1 hypothetical protein [Mucilaginibacter sp. 5C4]WPX24974.1 hypothetical protein RHM67_06825 [Mucilaginibacter sp. 5C4]
MKNDLNISGILADTEKLKDANIELEASLKKLRATQEKMASGSEKFSRAYQDNAVILRKAEAALKSNNEQIDKNIKMLDMGKGSLEKNKALLESLKDRYVALTSSQGDHAAGASKLNGQIALLSKTVGDQGKKLEKSRGIFDAHEKSVAALSSSFETLKTSTAKYVEENPQFATTLDDAAAGFNAMKTGLSAIQTGFKSVGSAIKTTGFGLLVLVLQSLVEYFTTNTEGLKKLHGAMAVVEKVVTAVKNGFAGMGEIMVNAFSHPMQSLEKIGNFLRNNFLNRLKAIGVILDGIIHLDFKKIGDGLIQSVTGVTNGTDKIKKAYNDTKKVIVKTYEEGTAAEEKMAKAKKAADDLAKKREQEKEVADTKRTVAEEKRKQANSDHIADMARMSEAIFKEYAKEVTDTEAHFSTLEKKYKNSADKLVKIEKDKAEAFAAINKKFQAEDKAKLDEYLHQLQQMTIDNLTDVKQKAVAQLALDTKDKLDTIDAEDKKISEKMAQQQAAIIELKKKGKAEEIKILEESIKLEQQILDASKQIRTNVTDGQQKKTNEINSPTAEVEAKKDNDSITKHEKDTAKQRIKINDELIASKMHAGDKYIDSVLKNSKKDSAIYKAAFLAKKATSIADVIISTKRAVLESLKAYSGIPFIGQALGIAQAAFMAGQGAMSIAEIAKQKPGFAVGGQYISDGRGALLPGYSRTDNTNAYLRSGEAVVVSEAMRNPWARNLVSAINVAHGGRDFSAPNTGSGYAIGGIFTDGGNANRYYNQPVNDMKDMANTLAYQMINNFPPIYVDVKDVNNQQNILAQTVNRVNL